MLIEKLIKQSIILILCILSTKSQNYETFFQYNLPPQKEIRTLQKIVNSTPIKINTNPQHSSCLQNQPYSQIKDLIAVNITYSISDGFESEWPQEKRYEKGTYIVTNDTQKLIQQQQKSPIKCKTTTPQIVFTNTSSFLIQTKRKVQSSKIITNYEELLYEEDVVLDVWKSQLNNKRSIILVIMSSGELIAAYLSHHSNGSISYEFQKHQLANKIKDASFNSQRYVQEQKLYLFSNEIQLELQFTNQHRNLSLNHLQIDGLNSTQQMVNFQWIQNKNNRSRPDLAILTTKKLCIYDSDKTQTIFKPIQKSQIGSQQIDNFLRAPISATVDQNGNQITDFKRVFFIREHNVVLLWEKNLGLIFCKLNSDNSFKIISVNAAWGDCYDVALVPNDSGQQSEKINFYKNCHNQMSRIEMQIKENKLQSTHFRLDGFYVPAGEIILQSSSQGDLSFVLGQTKIMGFRSWNFPKMLQIENQIIDNLFFFGNEYVSVIDNRLTFGKYRLVKEQIVCAANPNYKSQNQYANNSTQKTSKSDPQTLRNSTNKNRNLVQNQGSENGTFSILIEYLAQCNSQVLTTSPYFQQPQSYPQYKYCRYKKLYTDVNFMIEGQQSKNSSEKIQLILIVTFSFSAIVLLVGIGIWYFQKRKIGAFLEIQGMPVGSEDLDSNPNQNNLNLKLN